MKILTLNINWQKYSKNSWVSEFCRLCWKFCFMCSLPSKHKWQIPPISVDLNEWEFFKLKIVWLTRWIDWFKLKLSFIEKTECVRLCLTALFMLSQNACVTIGYVCIHNYFWFTASMYANVRLLKKCLHQQNENLVFCLMNYWKFWTLGICIIIQMFYIWWFKQTARRRHLQSEWRSFSDNLFRPNFMHVYNIGSQMWNSNAVNKQQSRRKQWHRPKIGISLVCQTMKNWSQHRTNWIWCIKDSTAVKPSNSNGSAPDDGHQLQYKLLISMSRRTPMQYSKLIWIKPL